MFSNRVCGFVALIISTCLYATVSSDNQIVGESHCEKWGIQFGEGQSVPIPGQCMQATCTKASNNEFSTLGCPVFKLRAGCHVTEEDLSKSYPECCPQPVCPTN